MLSLPRSDAVDLHLLKDADAPQLQKLVDLNRDHLARWLPWAAGQSLVDSRAFIARSHAEARAGESLHLAIALEEAIVGIIGFSLIDWSHCAARLGYWLAESAQGRGIATEAAAGAAGTNGDKGGRGEIGPQGPGAIKIAAVGSSAVSGAEELATVGPWALTLTCTGSAPNTTVTIKGPGELTQSVTTGGSPVLSGAAIGSGATLKINTGTRLAETGFLASGSTTYELNIQMTAENGGLFESCPVVGDAIPVPAS